MSRESRLTAGILLLLLPTVVFGGTSILSLLVGDPGYAQNQLRQDLWRAGHAHAGVLLVLSLVALRYVDEAALPQRMKTLARHSIPAAAILLPIAFFLSVLSPDATEPNALIYLAYVGAVSLAVGLLVLGVGLIRSGRTPRDYPAEPGNREVRRWSKKCHSRERRGALASGTVYQEPGGQEERRDHDEERRSAGGG